MPPESRFETDPDRDVLAATAPTFRYLLLYQEESGIDWLEETLRASGQFGLPGRYLEARVREANARRLDPSATPPTPWTDAAIVQHLILMERHRTTTDGCFGLTLSLADFARIAAAVPDATWFFRFDATLILRRSDRVAGAVDVVLREAWATSGRRGKGQMNEASLFPNVAMRIGLQARMENLAFGRLLHSGAPTLDVCKEDLLQKQDATLKTISDLLSPSGDGPRLVPTTPMPQVPETLQRFRSTFKRRFLDYINGERDPRSVQPSKVRSVEAVSSSVEEIVGQFAQCRAPADFYRLQIDLENLSTPQELLELRDAQSRLPGQARLWIRELSARMLGSDTAAQPFRRESVTEGITLFTDQRGGEQQKALLLVFCGKVPRPFMPTAVFLQALQASRCDVALLTDRATWFMQGMADYARDLEELGGNLRRDLRLASYGSYSCAGVSGASAGAVATGLMIGARNAVSLGGRAPAELLRQKPIGQLDAATLAQSFSELALKNPSVTVRLVYSEHHESDRQGANDLHAIFGGSLVELAGFSDHNIFFEQRKAGRLKSFLWETLAS